MKNVFALLGLSLICFSLNAHAASELSIMPDMKNVSIGVANGTDLCGQTCPPIKASIINVGSHKSIKLDLLVAPDMGCAIKFQDLSAVTVTIASAPDMGQDWRFTAPGSLSSACGQEGPRELTLTLGALSAGGLRLHKTDGTSILIQSDASLSKVQITDVK